MNPLNQTALDQLTAGAERADRSTDWPTDSWQAIRNAGVLRSSIPVEYGGTNRSAVEQLIECEAIASCCMTTAFILGQREAALRTMSKGPASLLKRYLPPSAAGDAILTIGLSQLTTSRQHGRPALTATPVGDGGFRLNGEIPWVTAADHATAIVGGAVCEDGLQLLFVLPTDLPGVIIEPPLDLAGLAGSRTSLVKCQDVTLRADDILAGPAEKILGSGGGGGLDTSCLAIGLANAALDYLRTEAKARVEVAQAMQLLDPELVSLRNRLHEAARLGASPEQVLKLRSDSTLFALRTTQLTLLTAKGTGFVSVHPAQRWARQALFFLVWSCPRPVSDEVREYLMAGPAQGTN